MPQLSRVGTLSNPSKAAGESFSPSDISGLVLWLDSVDTSTILNPSDVAASNGDNVKTWSDKSGNGYDLTQATANKQPVFRSSGVHFSTPSIDFDDVVNGTQLLNTTDTIQTAGNTVFFVFSNGSLGGASGSLFTGGTSNGQIFGENGDVGGTDINLFQFAGAVVNQTTYTYDTPAVASFNFNGASSKHWKNGSLIGTANAGALTSTGLSLGAVYTGASPCDIEIGSFIVYDSILSDADREAVEAYLTTRYGI